MQEELKAVIEKNLPAQVGETLKQRLAQAETDAKLVQTQLTRIASLEDTVKRLENTVNEYRKNDERNAALDAREQKVQEAERNLKIASLEYQLQTERDKSQFTRDVALGLVRNTTYRRHIFDSENQNGYQGPNGNWVYPTPVNKSLDETKTTE